MKPRQIIDCRRTPEQNGVIISTSTAVLALDHLCRSLPECESTYKEEINELKDAAVYTTSPATPQPEPTTIEIPKKLISPKIEKARRYVKSARHAFSQVPPIEGVDVATSQATLDAAVEAIQNISREIEDL